MGNTPNIRFKGFTDDWEQRKLEDVVEFLDTMRKPLEGAKRTPGPYPYYGASGIVDYVDGYLFDEELVLLSEDGANITDRNYPVCFLASGKYWVNNHAHVLRTKDGNENNFICNSLERKDYKQYNSGMAMPKLNQEVCRSIPISCPSFDEQKKIGDYFRNLDHLITLHQRKQSCNTLFINVWEQRKLSEVAEIVGGGTPSTNIPEYWDGDIDWYAPAEINDQIYVDGSERKITKLGLEKSSAKILPADKTVLFTSRAGIGKTSILRRSGATNQGFQSMVLNNETNPYFVFSMSKFIKEEAERVASGSTFAEVSGKILGNLAFMFPTKKEQDKIGEYFSNLDNLITLHQRKCDEIKEIKKFMLQNMFPQKG